MDWIYFEKIFCLCQKLFFHLFYFFSNQKLLVHIILYRLFECCVCWWITLCSLSSLITCFSFNCKKNVPKTYEISCFPSILITFCLYLLFDVLDIKYIEKIFSLKLFVLWTVLYKTNIPKKNFLTNLIKSHFLAVNEIQRQNTVPSRSNSDMNYPHFYITFLFTFLIDVSSVSYIIFIIYIIYSSYAFIIPWKVADHGIHILKYYYIISYFCFLVFEYRLTYSFCTF